MPALHLYCVANDKEILTRDLLRSPEVSAGSVSCSVIWDAAAASPAYYDAIRNAEADILIFAHQDVFFPQGWFQQLPAICSRLSSSDPSWAVAGVFGASSDGQLIGHVWDSALGRVCGGPFDNPKGVASLDEIVLVLRRDSGVAFDPALPSFHLYGTDIVLEARKKGFTAYIFDLPIIHNSKPVRRLDRQYIAAYRFLVKKWASVLPWPTVIVRLTRNPLILWIRRLHVIYIAIFRSSTFYPMLQNPEEKSVELGFNREQ
jgi:hypothetical protein